MNVINDRTVFCTLLIAISGIIQSHRQYLMVFGCLPRVDFGRVGMNIFWPFFGQKNDKDDDESTDTYDSEILERVQWTTNNWIENNKYPLEVHNITTKDGYKLQMQRLPKPGNRPVLLVHGLLTSSLSWVLMGPKQSLAFLLHDKNYDVWLANLRGSATYGRQHLHLNVSSEDFWNFSFHEMGIYDLAAIIDHIRNESSFEQILLIAHSQAFIAILALCSMQPIYNERILLVQALAPIAKLRYNTKFDADDVRLIMKYIKSRRKSQIFEVFRPGELEKKCLKKNSEENQMCLKMLKLIAGDGQFDKQSTVPLIFGSLLQGGSLKEIAHLQQIWKSGDFISFDYGNDINHDYYGSVNPRTYNLTQIKFPMILYFGETDAFATPNGVHSIYSRLLSENKILGVYRIVAKVFNHLDFLCSSELKSAVNDKLIQTMESFLAGTLRYVIE